MANRFYGKMGKGAKRISQKAKRDEAYVRQLAIWNDGTGFIYKNESNPTADTYKRVVNPQMMLRVPERNV